MLGECAPSHETTHSPREVSPECTGKPFSQLFGSKGNIFTMPGLVFIENMLGPAQHACQMSGVVCLTCFMQRKGCIMCVHIKLAIDLVITETRDFFNEIRILMC